MLTLWSKYFSPLSIPSTIRYKFLRSNNDNEIDVKYIYFEGLSKRGLCFVVNLRESSGNIRPWVKIKEEFCLLEPKKYVVDSVDKCFRYTLEKVNKRRKYKFDYA